MTGLHRSLRKWETVVSVMTPYLLDINADYRSRCGRCGAEQLAAGGLPIESPSIVQAHKPDGERPVFFAEAAQPGPRRPDVYSGGCRRHVSFTSLLIETFVRWSVRRFSLLVG
jgi:hypothetical protein